MRRGWPLLVLLAACRSVPPAPGGPVGVRAVGAQGSAAPGAEVWLAREGTRVTGRCDDDGRAVFKGLPDATYDVYVRHSAGWCTGSARAGAEETALRLRPFGRLQGRVRDARSGELLPEFWINLRADEFPPGNQLTLRDADGLLDWRGLVAGRLHAVVGAPGHRNVELDLGRVGPGQDVEGLDLRLEPAVNVAGWVMDDATGRPLRGALVELRQDTRLLFLTLAASRFSVPPTRADGAFRFPLLAPGLYELRCEAPGFAEERRRLRIEAEPAPPALEVRLRALTASKPHE